MIPRLHVSSQTFSVLQISRFFFFFFSRLCKLSSALSYKKPVMRDSAALFTNRKRSEQDFLVCPALAFSGLAHLLISWI